VISRAIGKGLLVRVWGREVSYGGRMRYGGAWRPTNVCRSLPLAFALVAFPF
jgi:hypothetical protein